MSTTRTFKIGDAEIFQNKPNQEAKQAIKLIHKKQEEMGLLHRKAVENVVEKLVDLSDSDLLNTLTVIVRKVKEAKQEKENK